MPRTAPLALLVALAATLAAPAAEPDAPFAIHVVDEATGRGVPLVELETTNAVRYVTDSAGYVALREPVLFGRKAFFTVKSHGYEFAKDAFGYPGKALDVTPGGEATLEIRRLNIAERLYRVTGGDIYRDSVILGRPAPIEQPLINSLVYGSDSVLTAVYEGKVRWFWGDTLRPGYPLGLFDVPGAVSDLPSNGGLDPAVGVNLTYFEGPDGFARATAKMPGSGPTWIDALTVLKDRSGRERMFAGYVKVKPPLSIYARGLAEWNDEAERFEKIADLDLEAPALPGGHTFTHATGGVEHVYFAKPHPQVRVRATPEDFTNLAAYEAFTCLVEGSRVDSPKLDRTADGALRYSWKKNTPPLSHQDQVRLLDSGVLRPGEGPHALRDRDTGKAVIAHGGSVYWNEYRKKWVMIFVEGFGKPSFLGEVWYAEGDTPVGPWVYAVKVLTHDRYDYYNPKQHPMFDADGGRTIYFEGTYTNTFSGNPQKTPRYEYNQMMCRLDLADPRLALPVPIYQAEINGKARLADGRAAGPQPPDRIAFFALDREVSGAIPIYEHPAGEHPTLGTSPSLAASKAPAPVFYALPADAKDPPATAKPLYEFTKGEDRLYSTQAELAGYARAGKPLCLVWENPLKFTWAVEAK